MNDPAWRERAAATGVDPEHQHEINVAVINQALAGRPDGLTVTVHMCRGNYRSAWFSSGGYDFVAEAVFSGLQADGYFLEYDDERSGTFEPLRFVPAGRVVVLGLVTTKTPVLESRDDLKRRVEAAARYVDADRLCLSPQCGFASTVDGNALTLDQQRAKLDLVVETAADLWGSDVRSASKPTASTRRSMQAGASWSTAGRTRSPLSVRSSACRTGGHGRTDA